MVTDDDHGEQEAHGEQEQGEEAGDEGISAQEVSQLGTASNGNQLLQPEKKKRERKEPVVLVRETGKSLLPFSRVQKIIKADKDIPMVAKDATFLISLATEEFIKRLSEASKRVAERERRSTVQHKDIATAVRRGEEFVFLEEIIPWLSSEPVGKRKPKGASGGVAGAPTLLDQFVVTSKVAEDDHEEQDIIMNEDGTMVAAGDDEIDFD